MPLTPDFLSFSVDGGGMDEAALEGGRSQQVALQVEQPLKAALKTSKQLFIHWLTACWVSRRYGNQAPVRSLRGSGRCARQL